MHGIIGLLADSGRINWQKSPHNVWGNDNDVGLQISFPFTQKLTFRDAQRIISEAIIINKIDWIIPEREIWHVNISLLIKWLEKEGEPDYLKDLNWLSGVVRLKPELIHMGRGHGESIFCLNIYQDEYLLNMKTKIFLSHKGSDKPMVRRFHDVLEILGFEPWLDEEAMPAGTERDRGILQGFKDSCASIFFITPNFKDERFIRNEINYAIEEKTQKSDRFSIITLVFSDEYGNKGSIPDLLHTYIWKEPKTEMEALMEIIKALPIKLGAFDWKLTS
jgi:hypothetical protein